MVNPEDKGKDTGKYKGEPAPIIRDFVFKDVDGKKPGANVVSILDLRLLEKTAITFKANPGKGMTYKWEILDSSGNSVRSIVKDRALTRGDHNWIWDGRIEPTAGAELELKAGKYKSKITVKKKGDETSFTTDDIELKGDPYNVTIVVTPKTDDELKSERKNTGVQTFDDYSPISKTDGWRIHNTCYVKVFRGKASDQILVGQFDGNMESTSPGNCSTPKGEHKGRFYVRGPGKGNYQCVLLFKDGYDDSRDKIPLKSGCSQPSTGNSYKEYVEIHMGASTWANTWTSEGCITIKSGQYPNNPGTGNSRLYELHNPKTGNNFLEAVYGNYLKDEKVNDKIDITVKLEDPSEPDYQRLHEDLVCNFETKTGSDWKFDLKANPNIMFFLPCSVLRDFSGEKVVEETKGNVKRRWAIAKETPDGLQIIRTIAGSYKLDDKNIISPTGHGNDLYDDCAAGQRSWNWNGKDPSGKACDPGDYKCILETKFTSPYRKDEKGNLIVEENTLASKNAWEKKITI
jgi:flagellar hook assembly protein FlgD